MFDSQPEAGVRCVLVEPAPSVPPQPRQTPVLFAALMSGGLLWLCFFPVNWGWLGWVALLPLLVLVRAETTARRRYLSAWASGLVFFWSALQWLRVADERMYATWAILATLCSLFVPMALWLIRRLDQRQLPLILTVPVAWVALEYLRAHVLTGFPWYFLAHTQHAFLPVIQIADLGGAYAVSFVVAAVNATLFELLVGVSTLRRWLGLPQSTVSARCQRIGTAVATTMLMGCCLGYGFAQLAIDSHSGPRVALVQGNVDQRLKNIAALPGGPNQAAVSMIYHYRDLSDQAAAQRPDLIVWPETSYPGEWYDRVLGVSDSEMSSDWREGRAESLELADKAARRWRTNVLLGLNARVVQSDQSNRRYNSALLVRPDGTDAGRYDKIHCVPFGEYVPLRDVVPWMKQLAPYDYDYSVSPGSQFTRFPLAAAAGELHFGVIICFEDTDPTLARQYVRGDDGTPVDFLVNISNDGWFDGSSEHEEHLAICRFRAVECRRAVVRAVNMGISAVIDGSGRVTALPAQDWSSSKKIATVLTAAVPLDQRRSLYARWGDWLPWMCWVGIAVCWVWPRTDNKRHSNGQEIRS